MAMAMNVVTMPQTLRTTLGSEKYYSLFGCKSCVLRSVFSTTTALSPKFREKFGTWPGGWSWMVGRNPCRPIRAVADVSYERGMEMAVQEHADHLLILVHGVNASLQTGSMWKTNYAPSLVTIFLSLTQVGIDLGGKRLADEVWQIVSQTKGFKHISFLAHSLGGLFSRYAIADLYRLNDKSQGEVDICSHFPGYSNARSIHCKAKLAGLDPVNFITIATSHLGLWGSGQMPMLLGLPVLEMLAATFTSGRTRQQLFLTDGNSNDPPLLLRMAYNCTDGPFMTSCCKLSSGYKVCKAFVTYIVWNTPGSVLSSAPLTRQVGELTSALQAFESRVTYANLNFAYILSCRTPNCIDSDSFYAYTLLFVLGFTEASDNAINDTIQCKLRVHQNTVES